MKKSAQNRIIIWSIVSVVIITILVAGFVINANGRYVPSINQRMYKDYYDIDTETAYNQSEGLGYSNDELSYIDIYLSNGKVIFEESDSDIIEIVQLRSSSSDEIDYYDQFYYQYDGTSLCIYGSNADFDLQDQDFSSFDFTLAFESLFTNAPSKTIVVKMPKNAYLQSININTVSADIEIDKVNTDYFTINSFSGSISLSSVKASSMSIQNVNGSVDLSNITSDDLSVNNVSGDVDVNGDIEMLSLESVSGDLSYSTNLLRTDSISVNTVSGDTDIMLSHNCGFHALNSSVSGSLKSGFNGKYIDENYVYGDGSTEIVFNSVSGSINIQPIRNSQTEQAKSEQKENEDKAAAATAPTETTSPTATTAPVTKKTND